MSKKTAKKERIGEVRENYQGRKAKIIGYEKNSKALIQFLDKNAYTMETTYQHFKDGKVKNPYLPTVFGIGVTGAKYKISKNRVLTKEYKLWHGMMSRCFGKNASVKYPSYLDCSVCEDWLLFENFYEWLISQPNYPRCVSKDFSLDKDILSKGNKIYSPDCCCVIPRPLNSMFHLKEQARKSTYSCIFTNKKSCQVFVNVYGKSQICLGTYYDIKEAIYAQKNFKENYVREVAKQYFEAGDIPESCYKALLEYKYERNLKVYENNLL